jgi:hypothetical protein
MGDHHTEVIPEITSLHFELFIDPEDRVRHQKTVKEQYRYDHTQDCTLLNIHKALVWEREISMRKVVRNRKVQRQKHNSVLTNTLDLVHFLPLLIHFSCLFLGNTVR